MKKITLHPKRKTLYFIVVLSAVFCFSFNGFSQNETITQNATCNCKDNSHTNLSKYEIQELKTTLFPKIVKSNLVQPDNWTNNFDFKNSKTYLDNKGTDFWLCMPQNHESYPYLYLDITSDETANGTIEIPGVSFVESFISTPGDIIRITLPVSCMLTGSETIQNFGIHVTSDEEVTVYGLNLYQYTSDAYLALPVDILSTNYLIMSYPKTSRGSWGKSQFAVVSPYDNNIITITVSDYTSSGHLPGDVFQVTLNQGETYQVQGTTIEGNDLTGTIIQSTLPVAVFGGNKCADIPWDANVGYCDFIVEQIPSISTWGTSFITYPLEFRQNGDLFRILASQDNTELSVDGVVVATLNFGDFYEDIFEEPKLIETTQPALLVQYSMSNEWDPENNGDPFMMIIPPYDQFLANYTFATPSSGFILNYSNITLGTVGVNSQYLDGNLLDPALFVQIGTSDFSGLGTEIIIGSHTAYNETTPFGLYTYGFNQDDSYGYPGGLSLQFINPGSAPEIERTPETVQLSYTSQPADVSIPISAIITDPEEPFVQQAVLYYRTIGETSFLNVIMSDLGSDIYSADIEATVVVEPGVEYYISATDGQYVVTDPSINPQNEPYSIAVFPNEVPQIIHTPVTYSPLNQDILISAEITDQTNYVEYAAVKYREPGGNPVYTVIDMTTVKADQYEAVIPASVVNKSGVEYYIYAEDDYGTVGLNGTPDDPHFISTPQSIDNNTLISSLNIFPNPYNPNNSSLKINYTLAQDALVSAKIYGIQGAIITTIFSNVKQAPGVVHKIEWNGRNSNNEIVDNGRLSKKLTPFC